MNTRSVWKNWRRASAVVALSVISSGALAAPAEEPHKSRKAAHKVAHWPRKLSIAVDTSIHKLKVPVKPEYLEPGPVAVSSSVQANQAAPGVGEDGRELPPEKLRVAWPLDYPMPGELAVGRWRATDGKAIGAVATFPIPKLELPAP